MHNNKRELNRENIVYGKVTRGKRSVRWVYLMDIVIYDVPDNILYHVGSNNTSINWISYLYYNEKSNTTYIIYYIQYTPYYTNRGFRVWFDYRKSSPSSRFSKYLPSRHSIYKILSSIYLSKVAARRRRIISLYCLCIVYVPIYLIWNA